MTKAAFWTKVQSLVLFVPKGPFYKTSLTFINSKYALTAICECLLTFFFSLYDKGEVGTFQMSVWLFKSGTSHVLAN